MAPAERRSLLLILLLGWTAPAMAVDVDRYPSLVELREQLVAREGFSGEEINRTLSGARIVPEIIELITRPKEALPWHAYRRIFVTEQRARQGAEFWREHAATLARAAEHFKVDPEIIVAILGVETRYGRHNGRFPVLDALTTLTLEYPPRATFFRRQLGDYLVLARDLGVEPASLKGSYAGAIGMPQFIPSSYRSYAVDFDGDRRPDLIGSIQDVIGSVANYFRAHGWIGGGPVADYAALQSRWGAWLEARMHTTFSSGLFRLPQDASDQASGLLVLEGERGPELRLVYPNFDVIMRYNRSPLYALVVHELSQMVRDLHVAETEERP